jgi:hypothetical protein
LKRCVGPEILREAGPQRHKPATDQVRQRGADPGGQPSITRSRRPQAEDNECHQDRLASGKLALEIEARVASEALVLLYRRRVAPGLCFLRDARPSENLLDRNAAFILRPIHDGGKQLLALRGSELDHIALDGVGHSRESTPRPGSPLQRRRVGRPAAGQIMPSRNASKAESTRSFWLKWVINTRRLSNLAREARLAVHVS